MTNEEIKLDTKKIKLRIDEIRNSINEFKQIIDQTFFLIGVLSGRCQSNSEITLTDDDEQKCNNR